MLYEGPLQSQTEYIRNGIILELNNVDVFSHFVL